MPRSRIRSVFVIGGTHGNERAGIHLAHFVNEFPSAPERWPTLSVHGIISNLEASKRNLRYVEEDLNRCFSISKLPEISSTLESKRAKEINNL